MMRKEVIMPKIGLDMDEGTISEWHKSVGDKVVEGEPLVDIETDKAVTTVESALNGTLVEIVAQEGDTVEITKTIAWVEVDE
jgi:pyruvate/2-oxoglutarate dehydrogenase complex dihydrolipoamide acyltransferase (E2) component